LLDVLLGNVLFKPHCWCFQGYNRKTSKKPDSIDDSQVTGGTLLEKATTLMTMSEAEMNAGAEIKDIKQAPLEHGYTWDAGDLHCDFALRSEKEEGER